ncbi:MAG: hypothetical protein AB8B94_09855 [Hyphomicrobiales bacterium]
MKKAIKKPASSALKAIKKYGFTTTRQRDAIKRRPPINVGVIRHRRKMTYLVYDDDRKSWKKIRGNFHKNFGSVDLVHMGMADPLEQERTRLAVEDLVSEIAIEEKYETVFHLTLALPQHTVKPGQLYKITPAAVRRNFEDTMRKIRKEYPDAFSIGVVEVQAIPANDEHHWSVHLHVLVFNVPKSVVLKRLSFRKITRVKSAYKPFVGRYPETKHALLVWSNYITKHRVYKAIFNRRRGEFLKINRSEGSLLLELKKEIIEWYSSNTAHDLVSFVGVPQSKVKRFYNDEMESIFKRRNKNWKKLIAEDYLW